MADSLVLKGYRDVKKHAGSEMQIVSPPRGGQKYPVKKWWANKGTASYVPCAVFAVTYGVDTCYLALNVAEMSTLRVDHLDAFEFRFSIFTGAERAALFTDSWELIEHYLFPRISGGKVVTVTPPGAAAKPDGSAPVPDTTVDSVSIAGTFTVTEGDTESYVATVTGDATPFTYSWSITGGAIDSGNGTTTAVVTWGSAGSGTITCLAGSSNANFDGNRQTDTRNVTVAAAPPPPPATGPADSVTLTGAVTTEAAGSITGAATTSANGSGLTVDYDSDGAGTASNLAIAAAGDGYEEGDSFTVDGDTGVTGTVSLATTTAVATETGPKEVDGYYPLYDLEASAEAAGDGTTHSHTLGGVTYYMPNGVTFYHGNYGQSSGY